MNQDRDVRLKWATEKATKDPDESARPLWRQIAGEVEAYIGGEALAPADDDHPSLFGDAS
jgi:hypothetical protein